MQEKPEIIQPAQAGSTNSHLKELLKQQKLSECSVVITNNQVAGRGQPGNKWETQPGKNLTFSMILYPHMIKASEQFIISKMVSVAIIEVLDQSGIEASIKWPNDIYAGNLKLGGILIENTISGSTIDQCIIGIGLNVNQDTFPNNLPNPVSIKNITGIETDLLSLFQKTYESLVENYALLTDKTYKPINIIYQERMYRKSGMYFYRDKNGLFEAEFAGISPAGHLNLKRKDGKVASYAFKEVEFVF